MPQTPDIRYTINQPVETQAVIELFKSSGLRRPVEDVPRIERMLQNANLIAAAWEGKRLAGIARCVTDFSYCCYLSDLAVDKACQRRGVGRGLITTLREFLGDEVKLMLYSVPTAVDFYLRAGFERSADVFHIPRKR